MNSQVKNTVSPYSPGLWQRITEVLDTQKTGEIADLLKISPSSVSDWKHGRTTPSLDRIGEIAFYGDTTIEYLISGEAGKRHQQGDTTYFEIWFLSADYRKKLASLAEKAGKPVKEMAQTLLSEAIDRVSNESPASEYETLLRKIVRDEIGAGLTSEVPIDLDEVDEFDLEVAVNKYDNAIPILQDWYRHDGLEFPDVKVLAFSGWEKMTVDEKIKELRAFRGIYERQQYRRKNVIPPQDA